MTLHLPAGILAELDQWEAGGRDSVKTVVAEAVRHLEHGDSPAELAHTLASTAAAVDPGRVATGFAWAVVTLAEQARRDAS